MKKFLNKIPYAIKISLFVDVIFLVYFLVVFGLELNPFLWWLSVSTFGGIILILTLIAVTVFTFYKERKLQMLDVFEKIIINLFLIILLNIFIIFILVILTLGIILTCGFFNISSFCGGVLNI